MVIVAEVPLNVTVPVVVPKLVPVIVTEVFTAPEVTDRLVMPGVTANGTPLLAIPPAVTTTLPVVAPVGTCAKIDPVAQPLIDVAGVPLKVTVPCVVPKFDPVIFTKLPGSPDGGVIAFIHGVTVNVNAPMPG